VVSKCSNPGCSRPFRYLHEGRLFRVETEFPTEASSGFDHENDGKRASRHVEFYWLCAECSHTTTIHYDPEVGVTTLPLVTKKVVGL
jgi:hypothetical protein